MNKTVTEGLKWESLYHVENGESDDNGQVRDQDSQDHEIKATLGPLGSLVGRPAAVDGGPSSLCDLSKADISENFDVLVDVKFCFISNREMNVTCIYRRHQRNDDRGYHEEGHVRP